MAHGLGRLRKDVSATFGRDVEWDGTPALGVFEFLNRFFKAGNNNDVSEGRHDGVQLPFEITLGVLREEIEGSALQRGRSGEVSSYMKLVIWLLRKYAEQQSLSDQDALFHGASQENGETKNDLYVRFRRLRRL